MVIDTGRALLSEVARAVEVARNAGAKDIIIQHSPDGHPALPEAHNLRILQTYEKAFGLECKAIKKVREEGLEPSRQMSLDSKSSASTNSATLAKYR